jgi:uncharacterized protein (TIGR03435 family)
MPLNFSAVPVVSWGMSVIRSLIPALLGSAALFAQTPPARLEFEVASVKPSAPFDNVKVNIGVKIDGAQVHYTYFSLQDYLRIAYKVKYFQVLGPDFLGSERFDIDAKMPAGATREQVPQMLQALLADRFGIKLHHESKEFPVYGLIVAKGGIKAELVPGSVEEAAEDAKRNVEVSATGSAAGTVVNYGNGSYFNFSNNQVEVKKMTFAFMADMLARFVDLPVVDMTNLPGKYSFTLKVTEEDYMVMMIRAATSAGVVLPPQALKMLEGATDQSLYTALRAEGLSLEKRKAPLDVIVVDKALKTPTEN